MSTMCKGNCVLFKSESYSPADKYKMNVKWCSRCSMFMKVTSLRCPCCNTMLRTRSRHKKKITSDDVNQRQTLLISQEISEKSIRHGRE